MRRSEPGEVAALAARVRAGSPLAFSEVVRLYAGSRLCDFRDLVYEVVDVAEPETYIVMRALWENAGPRRRAVKAEEQS